MAAAAAAAGRGFNRSAKDSSASSLPSTARNAALPAGGIAAMAAAAAAKKSRNLGKASNVGVAGEPGGIAAMVAAAASNKYKNLGPASTVVSEPVGIAAMVAAAAANKSKIVSQTSAAGIAGQPGGIAAMAAAAAARKNDKAVEVDQSGHRGPRGEIVVAELTTQPTETASNSGRMLSEQENATTAATGASSEDKVPGEAPNATSTSEDAARKSAFAAKAAAYRRRKEKKDDKELLSKDKSKPTASVPVSEVSQAASGLQRSTGDLSYNNDGAPYDIQKADSADDGKSNFLASAAAYRKKKSTKNYFDDDHKIPNTFTISADLASNVADGKLLAAKSFDGSVSELSGTQGQIKPQHDPEPDALRPGRSFDSFFMPGEEPLDLSSNRSRYAAALKDLDDSSVALVDKTTSIDARMSETWEKGDTIPNWMSWANNVIRASDTDSVVGFEESMDLKEDFDDDSTIATYMDDSSVMSLTPARVASSILFDHDDYDSVPVVTPAKVAASILFTDSPIGSLDGTPSHSNVRHHAGRAVNDLGLDAGLAFGIQEVGLDAGLSFGGMDDFGALGMEDYTQDEEKSSPERRAWFKWGNNQG
jgi:hypothetical protein